MIRAWDSWLFILMMGIVLLMPRAARYCKTMSMAMMLVTGLMLNGCDLPQRDDSPWIASLAYGTFAPEQNIVRGNE